MLALVRGFENQSCRRILQFEDAEVCEPYCGVCVYVSIHRPLESVYAVVFMYACMHAAQDIN